MKLTVKICGRERLVEIERRGGRSQFRLDGRIVLADAVETVPGVYSILLGGDSFEVRVETDADNIRVYVGGREYAAEICDPRQWRRTRTKISEAEGRQQILAPMPGKIVRILAKAGDAVERGQGLMVVEAMKMQNEIKSPKSGKVERLMAREGQTVNAGEALAVVL
jgi:biotin carboxyl carrier protein